MGDRLDARLSVAGPPRGKARPRLSVRVDEAAAVALARTGRRVRGAVRTRTHTPWETRVAEDGWRLAWLTQGRPRVPDRTPFRLDVEVVCARPAGHYRKDGQLTADGVRAGEWAPRRRKPDLDNIVKLVLDGLNGAAWQDDSQLAALVATRRWASRGEQERVEVRIRALDADGSSALDWPAVESGPADRVQTRRSSPDAAP